MHQIGNAPHLHQNFKPADPPVLATRARLLVRGAEHQGRCEGYGLTVTLFRVGGGFWIVDGAAETYAHSAEAAEATCLRLLEQRADASTDAAPERRYRPHAGDVEARVVAGGVQL